MQHGNRRPYPLLAVLAVFALMALSGCISGTPLHSAAESGNTAELQSLMDKGADVNEKDVFNRTALMFAAYDGHTEVARLLLDKGADVNGKDKGGGTALTWAAYDGHTEVARLLLDNGADPSLRERHGWTALDIARDRGHGELIALLSRPEYSGSREEIAARRREAEAMRLEKEKLEAAQREFEAAKAANTAEAYNNFISKYPDSVYRTEAVKTLAGIYLAMPDSGKALEEAVSQYPDMIVFLPPRLRLSFIGPPGMQVYRIAGALSKGMDEGIILDKLRASKGRYKEFTLDEMVTLRDMGISRALINEMMASTARAEAASENAELKAEIARLSKSIEEMQARQASAPAAGQPASAQQAPGVGEAIANCTARLAALELCNQAPGGFIGQEICKAAAKSQFPCNQ